MAEHANVELTSHFLPGLLHVAAALQERSWLEDFPLVEAVLSDLTERDAVRWG